jgi:hypothetical protein
VTGKCGPVLELASIQERLVVAGQFERFAAFLGGRLLLRFPGENSVPRRQRDDSSSP